MLTFAHQGASINLHVKQHIHTQIYHLEMQPFSLGFRRFCCDLRGCGMLQKLLIGTFQR